MSLLSEPGTHLPPPPRPSTFSAMGKTDELPERHHERPDRNLNHLIGDRPRPIGVKHVGPNRDLGPDHVPVKTPPRLDW